MCNNQVCKFCGSNKVNKRGRQQYNNKQRYICRDCKKIWTEGKDERIRYSDEKRERVIKLYLENMGIRSIERIEGVPDTLILKWIKNFSNKIKEKIKKDVEEISNKEIVKETIKILEIDELCTYVKKNIKLKTNKKEMMSGYGLLQTGTGIKLLILK